MEGVLAEGGSGYAAVADGRERCGVRRAEPAADDEQRRRDLSEPRRRQSAAVPVRREKQPNQFVFVG